MDDDADGYRWEGNYEKSWELIKETETGLIDTTKEQQKREKRRLIQQRLKNVKLGVMRYLFVIIDQTKAMDDNDLKPNRLLCLKKLLQQFILEFYDQNPISQIGIIAIKNGMGKRISELSSNINKHVDTLDKLSDCEGHFSLYNGLELASQKLCSMPSYASREIIICAGALTSVDPKPIDEMLTSLSHNNIRVSFIGLAASVQLFARTSNCTQGKYHVMLDEAHLQEILRIHCSPPPATPSMKPSLVKMGFPPHATDSTASLCQCHVDEKTKCAFTLHGFSCPTCASRYCEVPVECKVCTLTLVCAPHLARSHHHLFPLDSFTEVPLDDVISDNLKCSGCDETIADTSYAYQCIECKRYFCYTCDIYIHDMLHHCPGCLPSSR